MSKGISATIPFLLASMAIMGQLAIAEDYPLRPMTVFGTTPAGTSVDLTTRFFGERIKAATGQPWVVENKPGAGGAIAAKAAATSRPDVCSRPSPLAEGRAARKPPTSSCSRTCRTIR